MLKINTIQAQNQVPMQSQTISHNASAVMITLLLPWMASYCNLDSKVLKPSSSAAAVEVLSLDSRQQSACPLQG